MSAPRPQGKQPKNCFIDPKSPYWQFDFVVRGNRERGSTGCIKASEAAEYVAERRRALKLAVDATEAGVPVKRGSITLANACQRYQDDKVSDQKAASTYRPQLTMLVALMPSDIKLTAITVATLLEYRIARKATSKAKGSTINREIELLRRVWRYAAALEFTTGVEPKWSDAIDRGAEVERKTDMSGDDETRLMDELAKRNPELALVAEFALIVGQRKDAVMSLSWSNLDLANRSATVLLKTKGDAPRPHSFPLPARAMAIIESFPRVDGCDRVFTYLCRRPAPARKDRPARVKGQRYPFSRDGWRRDWQRALAAAGIEDFRFHDLRHTAATRIVRRTGNLKVAQVLLGHTDIAQTSRYAHAFHQDVLDAMEKVAG